MNAAQFLSLILTLILFTTTSPAANLSLYEMKYEGGTLGLKPHEAIQASIDRDQLVIAHGPVNYRVPMQSISELSYSGDKHYRVGTTIAVAIFTLGIGLIVLFAAKATTHYVTMGWTEADGKKGRAMLRVHKDDYRGFLTALEANVPARPLDQGAHAPAVAMSSTPTASYDTGSKAMQEFRAGHPCPSTMSMMAGECPGYTLRYVLPLRCGGKDRVENIAWSTLAEAQRADTAGCAGRR